MKKLVLILLTVILSGCASRPDGLPSEVLLKITINGVTYEEEFDLEYKDGLAILTSAEIEEELDISSTRTPISYIDKHQVQIEFPKHEKLITFSSFKSNETRKITNYLIGFADASLWKKTSFPFLGTEFNLVTKYDSKINHYDFKTSMLKIWNAYIGRLGPSTDVVTFVELDWAPLSGGALAENVLGLFYQNKISLEDQASIQKELGWKPNASTIDYISTYYGPNGWKDYLAGTVAHELGHTYFGFGQTREKVSQVHELWFSLGLGLLYDIEITKKVTGKAPQMFVDSERVWKSYSTNREIDQRLINPRTTNDSKFGLDRKKVYAHSKAHAFLKKLRMNVGPGYFDKAVKRYLQDCSDCINGYQDFKRYLPASRYKIIETEKEFNI